MRPKSLILIILILTADLYILTGSVLSDKAAGLEFSLENGYQIKLGNAAFDSGQIYHKSVYLPSNMEYELNCRGNGSVSLSQTMRMRDLEFAVIIATAGELFSAGDTLNIELSYGNGTAELPAQMTASFYRMYEAVMPELAELPGWREIELQQPSVLLVYPQTSNTAFFQAYDYLKEWKAQKGLIVYEYQLPAEGTSSSLRSYIHQAYEEWEIPPEYVCLIGDAGGNYNIPTAFYGIGEGDHYYTTLSGDDEISDLHVGRLSFNTINEWQTIVYKTINYEKEPYMENPDWFSRVLLTGDPTNSGMSCVFTNINIRELITNNYPQYGFEEVYEESFIFGMLDGVNSGVSFFNYRGYWGMSGWYQDTANYLSNGMMLPFVLCPTCGTGNFAGSGSSRSEQFIRAGSVNNPKGGIGAVGTATSSTHTCFNNCYCMGTSYGLYADKLGTMGASHTRGKTALWLNYPQNPSDASTTFSYWNNLMGDPSVNIWIGEPVQITVNYQDHFFLEQESYCVQVIDQYGNGFEGLNCCLYNTDNDEQHFCRSDENGNCCLNISSFESENFILTISGENSYPFQAEVSCVDSVTLSVNNWEYADENSSGGFEPGESGTISFTVMNYSSNMIEDIEVIISCEYPELALFHTQLIDEILPGTGFSLENVTLSYNGTGTENIDYYCDVSLLWEANQFIDHYPVPVTGVRLLLGEYTFFDENNGIPEPGETVNLDFEIINSGDHALNALNLEITEKNNYLLLENNEFFIGDLAAGETYTAAQALSLEILADHLSGINSELYFNLTNASGFEQELILEFCIGETGNSEPTGPDAFGYCIYDEYDVEYQDVEYDWIEINDQEELPLNDPGDMGSVTHIELPFAFRFYNQEYSQLSVCSNGWIAPGYTASASFMNWAIPGEGGISPIIAVFWDDLKIASSSGVFYYYDFEQHYFVIEWDELLNDWDNSVESFQVIVYDLEYYPSSNGNNMMKFQYKDFNNTNQGSYTGIHNGNHGQFATIGIEDQQGIHGVQYTYNNSYPQTGMELGNESALVIGGMPVPDNSAWLMLFDVIFINNTGEEEITPGDSVWINVSIQNIGDQSSESIEISFASDDNPNITILNGNAIIDGISTGEIEEVNEILNFILSENCPPMEELEIELSISAGDKEWTYDLVKLITAPVLYIQENEIDFGEVMCGYPEEYLLELNNRGTGTLEIFDIVSSCEKLNYNFEPFVIEPGSSAETALQYYSETTGNIDEYITITSNAFLDSIMILGVTGIVLNPPQIEIDSSLWQVEIEENTIQEYSIEIGNTGEGTLHVESKLEGFYNCGLAARFEGGYLDISEPVITTDEFTVEAWARVDGPGFHTHPTNPVYVQRHNQPEDYRSHIALFAKDISGNTKFSLQGSTSTGLALVTDSPPEGEWHHYAAVVTQESAKLYIDGELRIEDINNETGGYHIVDHINLGAHIYSSMVKSSLNGALDEVRIWDHALSTSEIVEYMNKSRALDSEGLIAYWTFNNEANWDDLVNNYITVTVYEETSHEVSEAAISDWIMLLNNSLTLCGGDYSQVVISVDSSWLPDPEQDYETNLILTTNDPLQPEIIVPIIVQIVLPGDEHNEEITAGNYLGQSYPNPLYFCGSRSVIKIDYTLADKSTEAELLIYNIKGQRVRKMELSPEENGRGTAHWNILNDQDIETAAGVYFYILRQNDKFLTSARKLLLIR